MISPSKNVVRLRRSGVVTDSFSREGTTLKDSKHLHRVVLSQPTDLQVTRER